MSKTIWSSIIQGHRVCGNLKLHADIDSAIAPKAATALDMAKFSGTYYASFNFHFPLRLLGSFRLLGLSYDV